MDRQIRRLALALLGLFVVLFAQVNYIQVFAADRLANDPHNKRLLILEYKTDRGDILARDATTVLAKSVKSPGELKFLRRYQDGPLYAGVTGFYSVVYGRTELEQAYNDYLSGRADELLASSLVDQILGRPKRGAALITTIDPALQRLGSELLAGRAGAVVAMNPATGEILAMVSNPSYDPNPLAVHDPARVRTAWERLLGDPEKPMLWNANDEVHNPGSNFKMVVTAAALEQGIGPESEWPNPSELTLPGTTSVIVNAGGEPCPGGDEITMAVAFQYSCNVIFGEIGMELGPEVMLEQAEKFGFNTDVGLDIPSAPGQFPPVDSFQYQQPAIAYSAIGMRDVKANPLQMAMVASAIANGGTLMVPHLMSEIRDPQGLVVKRYDPHVYGQAVSPETAAALTRMMVSVVQSGTGTAAQVPGFVVAGKTGTAQLDPDLPPHVWFTGFAPADDNPAIVVSVMLLDGGGAGVDATGGRVAAPIAQRMMAEYLNRGSGP